MNKFIICGRMCNTPETSKNNDKTVMRFNFAVNRRFKQEGQPDADFFSCVAFGKTAETLDKCQVDKGTKLLIEGEVRNNNYTDKDGVKHYGTQVIVNSFEFCESKSATRQQEQPEQSPFGSADSNGFMYIPDGIDDELPFD